MVALRDSECVVDYSEVGQEIAHFWLASREREGSMSQRECHPPLQEWGDVQKMLSGRQLEGRTFGMTCPLMGGLCIYRTQRSKRANKGRWRQYPTPSRVASSATCEIILCSPVCRKAVNRMVCCLNLFGENEKWVKPMKIPFFVLKTPFR
jgi:hypothetical protein